MGSNTSARRRATPSVGIAAHNTPKASDLPVSGEAGRTMDITPPSIFYQTVRAGKTRSFMDSTRMLVVVGNLKYMMKKSVAWYVKPATHATVISSRIKNRGSVSLQ
ncbi:hypothetical protein HPB50_001427 [Hyalomma asiaticum]|uniref:Uncharacterized protein n=1 Tax=Hyalomma asiaticum TaxID=266040 RepID=A0ACB7T7A2_HYAAI|nr:hypothetical protein HPB50_001427 [Hyalomma asiaticum]